MTNLERWGWDAVWAAAAELDGVAAVEYGRVVEQERDRWIVALESGSSPARITSASFSGLYPVAGDWVSTRPGPMPSDPASIVGVLPRRSAISRGAAGDGTTEQVLAANVDVVWIVQGLDTPINLRSIERYLAIAWESGAVPEIVLTKADLAGGAADPVDDLGQVGIGVDAHLVSIEQPESIRDLRAKLRAGRTVALLGPSGAGKSTLINALAETSVAATGPVRAADRKGRHTTTRRELFQLPGGALLLDTPGLRELRVWDLSEGLQHAFPEIEELGFYLTNFDSSQPQAAAAAAEPEPVATVVEPVVEEPVAEFAQADQVNSGFFDLSDLRSELGLEEPEAADDSDYETKYQTAVAYQEMGLMAQAIAEFQDASSLVDPNDGTRRFFNCANLLGHCFVVSGMPKLAIKWYERALQIRDLNIDEKQALWYELGVAHEADGELARAGDLFEQVYAENVDYRDVRSRLRNVAVTT